MASSVGHQASSKITESMRNAYGDALAELGSKNKNIVVLDADLSCSTQTCRFAKKFPERFFNVGIAEQDMIDISAGLSLSGKTVFVSSFAVFISRAYEQIRNAVAYSSADVKIVSTHSGINVGEDGSSHQMLEDFALFRTLPNFRVFVPADAGEAKFLTNHLVEFKGPAYMRLPRMSVLPVYLDNYAFKNPESAVVLKEGKEITIIATGLMVKKALEAAELLQKEKISAEVINLRCLKPIDAKTIIASAKKTGKVLTVEEHQIINGMGSAVAEVLSESHPVKIHRMGMQDRFGESGTSEELFEKFGLTSSNIYKNAKKLSEGK